MKKNLYTLFTVATLLASPFAARAATFFNDDFSHGSTTNQLSAPGGTPTASFTSYDLASTKNATASSIAPGLLRLKLTGGTSSGGWETQALFTSNAVALGTPGDYIDMAIVFTNALGTNVGGETLFSGGNASSVWVGLFNSGGVLPVSGALANAGLSTTNNSFSTGNCANWQGYVAQIYSNAGPRIITRPLQNGATLQASDQDLLGNNAGSGFFHNPTGTVLATGPVTNIALVPLAQYTLQFRLTLDPAGSGELIISNALYSGVGTTGTVMVAQSTNTPAAPLSVAYDGLSFGTFNKAATGGSTTNNPQMDVTLITITGVSTVITSPPSIDTNPVPVIVANGGSCEFSVAATGVGVSYQWKRHGTNLVNAGNISGVTTPNLIISPAGSADALSGANGYYVVVTGTGNYSTNSTTNSLTLDTAANLTWNPSAGVWDLANTADWTNFTAVTQTVFNFGDNVTFDNTGSALPTVNLNGNYLSAGSVTVNSTTGVDYKFQGVGSFAGPGALNYIGSGHLTLNNVNTYSGGTLVSNASAFLVLGSYAGLGSGPVTLAQAGGEMEITISGGSTTGIQGDVNVNDDFTIQFDKPGGFAGVFLGNLNGVSGKTLKFLPSDLTTSNRFRIYGTNGVCNANLDINGPVAAEANYLGSVIAFYGGGGTQTYNGVIEDGSVQGTAGIIQRGNGTTILNGQNTFSGGTTPTAGVIALGADSMSSGGNLASGPIGKGPLFLTPEAPNLTGSGTIEAWGGAHTIANPIDYPSATNNQTLIIGGTNALTFSGGITLNGDDATGTNNNRTFQVTNTALTTFSGVVSDNSAVYGLTKTGSGVLALTATETYTGPTTVAGGTLQVNGALAAASAVTAATNGTLAGNGTISGTVTINQGGTIAPGAASIGALTINNSLTINGNISVRVNRTGSLSDNAVVSGTLSGSGNGTITVTNLGSTLQVGDTFFLFNKPVTGAGGLGVALVNGTAGWTNKLAIDGSIQVVSNTLPTITPSRQGTNVTLSWPASYLGWLVQSNSGSITNSTNWFTIPNTGTNNSYLITINPARTNVFYRLKP